MFNLIKVRFEYADGTFYELVGEEVQKWLEMVIEICCLASSQGRNPFDRQPLKWYKWEITPNGRRVSAT